MEKAQAKKISDRLRDIYKHFLSLNHKKHHNQGELDFEFDAGFGQDRK